MSGPINCPWCDEKPTVYDDHDSTGPIHVVECDSCGTRAPAAKECDGDIRKDAISNWNLLFGNYDIREEVAS